MNWHTISAAVNIKLTRKLFDNKKALVIALKERFYNF